MIFSIDLKEIKKELTKVARWDQKNSKRSRFSYKRRGDLI